MSDTTMTLESLKESLIDCDVACLEIDVAHGKTPFSRYMEAIDCLAAAIAERDVLKAKRDHAIQVALNVRKLLDAAIAERDALRAENVRYREALQEVAKGEGPFSMDPFTHAGNCIDNMKELATAALSQTTAPEKGTA